MTSPRPIVALTTDFGWGSSYVAQVKGVLLSSLPEATLVDVAHDVPAYDVVAAALLVRDVAFSFPLGTTHLVVVDPGVGTQRNPIAVEARGMRFVGPDNGILGPVLDQPRARAVVLDRPALWREPLAPTFHGRDLFAPVAAELAGGLTLEQVGTPATSFCGSPWAAPERHPDGTRTGTTLGADRFGNLTTNLPMSWARRGERVRVGADEPRWVSTFGDAAPGELVVLAGSNGFVELAVREGSAVERLGRAARVIVLGDGGGDEARGRDHHG